MPLFDFLNNSIFSKTNDIDHQCIDSNCSGSRLHGLNLTCQRCLTPTFFDCIASKQEIKNLLKLLNPDGSSNQHIRIVSNSVHELFHQDSVFEFVCPKCKSGDSINDWKKRYNALEVQFKEIKKELTSMKNSTTKIKKENTQLKEQLIAQSQSSSPQLSTIVKDNESNQHSIIHLQNRVSSLESIVSDVREMIQNQLSSNVSMSDLANKLKNNLDHDNSVLANARVTLESIDSSHSSGDDLAIRANAERKQQQTKTNATTTKSHDLNRNIDSGDRHFHQHENSRQHNPSTSNETSSITTPNTTGNRLRPPKQPPIKPLSENGVFSIYVSKFDPSTNCDEIKQHIIDSIQSISCDSFTVEMLIGLNENIEKKTYVSFKITTLRRSIYEKIIDKNIWEPNFQAKCFDLNATNKKKGAQKNVHFEKHHDTHKANSPPWQLCSQKYELDSSPKTEQIQRNQQQSTNQTNAKISRTPVNASTTSQSNTDRFQRTNYIPMIYPTTPNFQSFQPVNHHQNFWLNHNGLHQPQYQQLTRSHPIYTQQQYRLQAPIQSHQTNK